MNVNEVNTIKAQAYEEMLLEILHVISSDGFYSDKEAIIEVLEGHCVSNDTIEYHLKK